jgi:hypothetical protein
MFSIISSSSKSHPAFHKASAVSMFDDVRFLNFHSLKTKTQEVLGRNNQKALFFILCMYSKQTHTHDATYFRFCREHTKYRLKISSIWKWKQKKEGEELFAVIMIRRSSLLGCVCKLCRLCKI